MKTTDFEWKYSPSTYNLIVISDFVISDSCSPFSSAGKRPIYGDESAKADSPVSVFFTLSLRCISKCGQSEDADEMSERRHRVR